jgi:hypothetical protein
MPHNQRFEVLHPALGPWTPGDVIERHVDLVGAVLPRLLQLRAIAPTDKPAFKAPRTIANLIERKLVSPRIAASLEDRLSGTQALPGAIPNSAKAPIPGIPSTSTISIPSK